MSADAQMLKLVRARMREKTKTDAGMRAALDDLFGAGNYSHDPREDVFVAVNHQHKGPGRGFYVIRRDGSWFGAIIPDGKLS